ncbi:MAG: hypothetical protein DRG33_00775 [Deltaproteobacteria bacterium]|nr:MAG: hypothetical protein DRG33_00775 [Deltaproteobacteria bacterium]
MPPNYKIVLMGFHQLICDILRYVEADTTSEVVAVVPQRSEKEVRWYDDIEKVAKEYRVPIATDEDLQRMEFDILLCVDYHHILKKEIFQLAKVGSFNIHGSLLPKYRGVAPYIRAVCNGEKKVGVTLHEIDEGVDTGDVVAQRSFEVDEFDTIEDVIMNHTKFGLECFKEFLNSIRYNDKQGNYHYPKEKQPEGELWQNWKYEEDGELNLSGSAKDFFNKVRMLNYPFPRAYIRGNDGKKIYIVLERE